MEFAWLDLFEDKWLLLNGNHKCAARSWRDEKAALEQLKEEGWRITRLSRKSRYGNQAYAVMRTIH